MKYKGFVIEKRYSICANWKLNNVGQVVPRRPKLEDIECYDVFDPIENMDRFCSEDSISDCKISINYVLRRMNMKDNTQKSWDKLDK